MSAFLRLERLVKRYPAQPGPVTIVDGFELGVREGELVCLLGHSGCGKSTVLSMVAGLVAPSSGVIQVDGKPIDGPGPDRGVVFQAPCLLPWMTAQQNVLLGVEKVHARASGEEQARIATGFLELVGLEGQTDQRPSELSAGARQRVGLARAFALSPRVLLLDEPFGMLDSVTRLELQEVLLRIWQQHRMTALMVTHDVDEALFVADRVVLMTNGPAAKVGEILDVPFARPRHRQALLESAQYYALRERMLGFLEAQDAPAPPKARVRRIA